MKETGDAIYFGSPGTGGSTDPNCVQSGDLTRVSKIWIRRKCADKITLLPRARGRVLSRPISTQTPIGMKPIGENMGVIHRPFSVWGMPLGKTTSVIRLSDGRGIVQSGGPWRDEEVAAIREWGELAGSMEGSRAHDTFAWEMPAHFPSQRIGCGRWSRWWDGIHGRAPN